MRDNEKDLVLKKRLMRFFWYNGYYVKRNVAIAGYESGTKVNQYTDIDVVCIKYSFDLTKTLDICDCKSGVRAKSAERIFWLSGVMKYFGASKGYFVRQEILESKYLDLANKLEITPLSEQQLTRLEKSYGIDTKPFIGNFEDKCFNEESEMLMALKSEAKIKKVYEYVSYDYWIQPSFLQINKLISCGKAINESSLEDKQKLFLSAYVLNLFLNSVLDFSHDIIKIPDNEKENEIAERILGGGQEKYSKGQLLTAFHKFMSEEIRKRYQQRYPLSAKDFMDNFYPAYLKDFIDLVQRICLNPIAFISTPQVLTILTYECILLEKEIDIPFLVDLFGQEKLHVLLKALTDVIIFGAKCGLIMSEHEIILSGKLHQIQKLNYDDT